MNRVNTYPITNEANARELNVIQDPLYNNEYNINLSTGDSKSMKNNKNIGPQHQTIKWAIFTYCGKETKKIITLFKETEIKVAFRTKKHNTKPNKTPAANRQVRKKWRIPNEMYGLATEIYRA
jgi:hypothetical protein